jgi:hypothetical protein
MNTYTHTPPAVTNAWVARAALAATVALEAEMAEAERAAAEFAKRYDTPMPRAA